MRRLIRPAIALGTAVLLALGVTAAATTTGGEPAQAASSGGVKFAYFTQWGIYGHNYYPKNLDTSGAAGKLDFLVYAFGNIHPTDLTCFEANKAASSDENNASAGDGAGDSYADYSKSYDAATSVDGVADVWNQPIVGNFNQLKKLKKKYPNLKIQLSIGGWTYSKYFSDVAATDAARKKFVSSCIDLYVKGNLPTADGYGGAGSGAGIFDGFDLDWEYPGGGGHTGNHASPNDKQNFTALLAEFRSQLDAFGTANGNRKMYLTAAVPAGQDKLAHVETDKVGNYLDYANMMTYDMHGAWETTTNHQAPLYNSPNDPMTPLPGGNGKYSIDNTVKAWTVGDPAYGIPGKFPANKLVMGYPLYYRGWVAPAGTTHGMYQTSTGPAAQKPTTQQAGIADYRELGGIVDNAAYTYLDPTTQAAWFYDGTTVWSGDNKASIKAKADYAHCQGLGGSMLYSMEALDPAATLFNEVVSDTNAATPGCAGPSPSASPTVRPSSSPSASPSNSPSASPSASPSTSPSNSPSASPSNSPSASPSASPTSGGCAAAAWNSTAVYTGGQSVSYAGHTWLAQWWTQTETPGVASVWQDKGVCGPAPSTSPAAPGTCANPAWSASATYTSGNLVSQGGHKWRAKWWTTNESPGVAQVWEDMGAC